METTRITRYYLELRYGPAVDIEYVDMMDAEAQARFSDVQALVDEQDLAYPLVAIDGQLRLAGSAHYFQIVPLVAQALEQQTAGLAAE